MTEQERRYFDYDIFRIIPGGKGSLSLVNKDINSKITDLQSRLDEATRLLRYQEERNHSLNERLNEAEDRLGLWRSLGWIVEYEVEYVWVINLDGVPGVPDDERRIQDELPKIVNRLKYLGEI